MPQANHCLLCPQTDTSDPEKVVSAFLKVSSVFKDEATVRTAVQDAVGNVGWVRPGCPLALDAREAPGPLWSPSLVSPSAVMGTAL